MTEHTCARVCTSTPTRAHTPRQTRHVQRVHLGAAVPFLRLTFCSALPCSQHPASDPWPHIRESIRIFNKWPWAFQVALVVKNQPDNAGGCKRQGFDPWAGKIPWRRARKPTPVFLPGESQGQRSLGGYSPQGHTEPDTTEPT